MIVVAATAIRAWLGTYHPERKRFPVFRTCCGQSMEMDTLNTASHAVHREKHA